MNAREIMKECRAETWNILSPSFRGNMCAFPSVPKRLTATDVPGGHDENRRFLRAGLASPCVNSRIDCVKARTPDGMGAAHPTLRSHACYAESAVARVGRKSAPETA